MIKLSLKQLVKIFLFSSIFGQLSCMLWILVGIFTGGKVILIEPSLFVLMPEIIISLVSIIFSVILTYEYVEKIRTMKAVLHK